MGQYRMQKLNGQLRDEISKLLLRGDIKDPRVSTFLSINRVEITTDLGYAKVYDTVDDLKYIETEHVIAKNAEPEEEASEEDAEAEE